MFDKFTLQNLANKSGGLQIRFISTSKVNSTIRRWFYYIDLGQIAFFTILQDKLHSFNHLGRSKHALPLHYKLQN